MPPSSTRTRTAQDKRLQQLAAAFDAYRRAYPRQRFPRGLRARAVAALRAGACRSVVCRTCGLSGAQLRRWLEEAGDSTATTPPAARVLSVVDTEPTSALGELEDELELRIGLWHLRLRRTVD
jgi:transposase-like protein